jgi:membrane peptidoglycan carboxypeptidase
LNEGVVSKENGSIHNRRTRRNLDDALAYSDNGYFQVIGSTVGNSKMIEYARDLGLGQQTGINAEGETAGKLAIGNNNARIYSHGDDFEVSTLQLAVMVSAIANGGMRVVPRTPRNTIEKTNFQTFYRQKVAVPQNNVRRVIPGMIGAAAYGTARRGVDASLGIAGKTGSCISKGTWVGLFASVAPIEKPKYSVVVITRGERERGKYAAAVAGQIYRALSSRIVRTDTNFAQNEFKVQPKQSVIPPNTPIDEEDDDANAGDVVTAGIGDQDRPAVRERIIVVPSASQPISVPGTAPKKLVVKTGQSRPAFPPVVITYDKDNAAND